MTDGIIQEVIKRHLHYQDGNEQTCSQCNKIFEIEQELIEEIKKLDKANWYGMSINQLIGDNE